MKSHRSEVAITYLLIDDLRKSRGLPSVGAYRYSLYIKVHDCGCSAE